jgi:tRNA(fMet)-specific endonuclease VapC
VSYLLDTIILLAYVRRGDLFQRIEATYALTAAGPAPALSVVSEGEIRALADEFSWGKTKRNVMENLLARFTVYPLPFANVIQNYVEVSQFSRKAGHVLGKNDLWIAARARTTGVTLLTTDKDFDHLAPALLARDWINPATS